MVESTPLSYSGGVRLLVRWKVIEILWLHFLSYCKQKAVSCRALGRAQETPEPCCCYCYLLCIFNPSYSPRRWFHSQSSREHTHQGHPSLPPAPASPISLPLAVLPNPNYGSLGHSALQMLSELPRCFGDSSQAV